MIEWRNFPPPMTGVLRRLGIGINWFWKPLRSRRQVRGGQLPWSIKVEGMDHELTRSLRQAHVTSSAFSREMAEHPIRVRPRLCKGVAAHACLELRREQDLGAPLRCRRKSKRMAELGVAREVVEYEAKHPALVVEGRRREHGVGRAGREEHGRDALEGGVFD